MGSAGETAGLKGHQDVGLCGGFGSVLSERHIESCFLETLSWGDVGRSSEGEPSPCQEEGEEEGEEAAEGEEQGGEGEGAGGEEEEGEEVEAATVRLSFAQYNQNVRSSVLVFQVQSERTNSVFLFSPLQPEYSVAVLVFSLNCEYNFLCFK